MINLGDEVKDKVTGFTGIAIAKHIYLNGCARYSVQQRLKKGDAKLPDAVTFDEPQLQVVKAAKVEPPTRARQWTGGPERYMPASKTVG